MKYYRLKNKEVNWGDYGTILLTGMTGYFERENNLLQLGRTGPFQPNIIIASSEDLVITDSMRDKLQRSDLTGLEFRQVIKKHISFVDWTTWDLQAEDPGFYPENGEPENYILSQLHSADIAEKMEPVWEVLVPISGTVNGNGEIILYTEPFDIIRLENRIWFIITEKMKSQLENNFANWLTFEEVKTGNK